MQTPTPTEREYKRACYSYLELLAHVERGCCDVRAKLHRAFDELRRARAQLLVEQHAIQTTRQRVINRSPNYCSFNADWMLADTI